MDGTQNQQQGFQQKSLILPIYQMIANVFESIYNGSQQMGDTTVNMMPREKAILAATKRTCVLLIVQSAIWCDEEKIFTPTEIKEMYKKDVEILMQDAAIWTKKAKLMGYLESGATSFYESMFQYKANQKNSEKK